MNYLFILNDPAYGTERSYNALRLAMNLQKQEPEAEITVFLMGDAVVCAKTGQQAPDGYYNLERMLKPLARKGEVLLCSLSAERVRWVSSSIELRRAPLMASSWPIPRASMQIPAG